MGYPTDACARYLGRLYSDARTFIWEGTREMISLLTLFFMVHADVAWYWYVAWVICALASLMKAIRETQQ